MGRAAPQLCSASGESIYVVLAVISICNNNVLSSVTIRPRVSVTTITFRLFLLLSVYLILIIVINDGPNYKI